MSARLTDLLRRVEDEQSSVMVAQLAEEYRRLGMFREAAEWCRKGLTLYPEYLSAHVILGRTLIELNQLDEAAQEFSHVLRVAPDNLAAARGLAEVNEKRGVPPVDFDAVLTALGAPGLSAPPVMERLLRGTEPRNLGTSEPRNLGTSNLGTSEPRNLGTPEHEFETLERQLRDYEDTLRSVPASGAPRQEVEEPAATPALETGPPRERDFGDDQDVLAELESWLSALRADANGDRPI